MCGWVYEEVADGGTGSALGVAHSESLSWLSLTPNASSSSLAPRSEQCEKGSEELPCVETPLLALFYLHSPAHIPDLPAQGDIGTLVPLLRQDMENPVLQPKKAAEKKWGLQHSLPARGPAAPAEAPWGHALARGEEGGNSA